MIFVSSSKLYSFFRFLHFCPDFKKAQVNFKIHNATHWNTHYYNEHIARYFKKKNQSDS